MENEIQYLEGSNALVVLANTADRPAVSYKHTSTINAIDLKTADETIELSPWGADNCFPQNVKLQASCSPVLSRAIAKRIKIHFGKDLIPYRIVQDGGEKKARVVSGDVVDFFKKNKVALKATQYITDYEWFNNFFVEMILSNDYTKINRINYLEASNVRLCTMDEDMEVRHCVYSKKWEPNNLLPKENEYTKLPIVNANWSAEEVRTYCKENKIKKYVIHYRSTMPGCEYYSLPYWDSVRKSGWLDIALLIPKVKKAVIKNSMVIKYIVKIPSKYWNTKYPINVYKDSAARNELINADIKKLDNFLKDYENTGGSFVTYYDQDEITKRQTGMWEIEAVDTKYQDGVLNLDSAAANSELLFGVGIDPSIIGAGMPGKELGGKSGSDKRESYNMAIIDAAYDRVLTTEYLRLISEYNGWDNAIQYGYLDDIITTLDKNPTGVQKANI